MPNFYHLTLSALYHLALAVWIGGGIALGALTAPELFRQLPRPQAGGIFGPVLRRFARLRLVAIVIAVAAAATKHLIWETHTSNVWILIRWVALAFMAVTVVYEIFSLQPAMERLRPLEDDGRRARFGQLHKRSEALMKASMAAAALAVFFS
jgi:uncharacterized membrane protein